MELSGGLSVAIYRCVCFRVSASVCYWLHHRVLVPYFCLSESVEFVPLVATLVVFLICTSTQLFVSLLCLCFVSAVILCILSLK